MNWINRIKPKIKSLFKKKSSLMKKSLWENCECGALILREELQKNLVVCPKCGNHRKVDPRTRFSMLFDSKEFEVLDTPLSARDDPLQFVAKKKYSDQLKDARKKTNQSDSILIAHGKLEGMNVTCAAMNFEFIGGSLSQNSGEAFISGIAYGIKHKTPFIVFTASGGARMQENLLSLVQMSRTALAVSELKRAGLPYLVVYTNPTSGGVTASFASLGDISIAEPGAIVAFAGARVIKDTVKEDLPTDFQKSEWIFDNGGLDIIVERKYLRSTIAKLLQILLKKKEGQSISEMDNVKSQINSETPKSQSA